VNAGDMMSLTDRTSDCAPVRFDAARVTSAVLAVRRPLPDFTYPRAWCWQVKIGMAFSNGLRYLGVLPDRP
jgi:hypothetical protein